VTDLVRCNAQVWTEVWHPQRCKHAAKYILRMDSCAPEWLCGIHAKFWIKRHPECITPVATKAS
jgi:hypothetical protein